MNPIKQNAIQILTAMIEKDNQSGEEGSYDGNKIHEMTDIEPRDINDAVEILTQHELIKTTTVLIGGAPYKFITTKATSKGKYAYYENQIL